MNRLTNHALTIFKRKKSTVLIFTLIFLFNLTVTGNNKHSKTSQFRSYNGLVMCGYQGWFRAEGDGSNTGWGHYGINGKLDINTVKVDLWPDVAEYEKTYPTDFKLRDGTKAKVSSPWDKSTVDLLYVAMFDEIDKGTAIFKCTNQIPVDNGDAKFIDYEGVASDHYLWLTVKASELFKSTTSFPAEIPMRE